MSPLDNVIHNVNAVESLFSQAVINPKNIRESDAIRLFDHIDSELSPENLYQDGERSAGDADSIYQELVAAATELHSKGFTPSDSNWEVIEIINTASAGHASSPR